MLIPPYSLMHYTVLNVGVVMKCYINIAECGEYMKSRPQTVGYNSTTVTVILEQLHEMGGGG